MGQRRRAREYALQMLFQIDVTGISPAEVEQEFWTDLEAGPEVRDFARELVGGVYPRRHDLDRWITGSAENWRIDRMAVVDRNVLRMAAFEMLHGSDAPPAVIIDEAVEVAKKYGSSDSGGFINGILDSLRRRLQAGERPPLGDGGPA